MKIQSYKMKSVIQQKDHCLSYAENRLKLCLLCKERKTVCLKLWVWSYGANNNYIFVKGLL